jgi:translocation and assembly module TamB
MQPPSPGAVRRRSSGRGSDASGHWDGAFARAICLVLAIVGMLPVLAAGVVRSHAVRDWVTRETQRLLREQSIAASYTPSLRLWPLAVALDRVRVESSDAGPPFVECRRVLVRPKLFALLAGKLAVDEIDLDEPRIRAVVRDGKLANLHLPEAKPSPSGSSVVHAPFSAFSVTEGSVDLDFEGVRVVARSIDVDASAEDDRLLGSTFEVALRTGPSEVHRPRIGDAARSDDDALCSFEARVRAEPDAIVVRRLDAVGMADMDPGVGSAPSCVADPSDPRRVELSLGHLHVELPRAGSPVPAVDGHVRVRAPLGLAARAASLPPLQGWIGADADVRYAGDTLLPEASGTLEAHDVKLAQYAFAQELHSEFSVLRNVVRSPLTTIRFAGGTVTLSDTVVDPLANGGKLESTRLDVSGVDFTALMRDLGVHPHSYVGWEIRELHAPVLAGGFSPLRIEGDFTAKTDTFGVYDRPADDPSRERIFGFSEAALGGRISVRDDALVFSETHADLPHSRLEGARVSLGFHNDLRIDAPRIRTDLADLSPIGSVPLHGTLEVSAKVGGRFNRPEPEADIVSATGFGVADVAFGDVLAGHVKVDVDKTEVDIADVRARRKDSLYEVSSAKLRFGGNRGFTVDAVGASEGLDLRDLLSMFALDADPRFAELDATIKMRADVHVALGGAEDACGGGLVTVMTKAHVTDASFFGERFARGDADVSLRWFDRQRGLPGADLDVRSFVLEKTAPGANGRAPVTGTLLGSASIKPGGALAANIVVENVPLAGVDALGPVARQLDGRIAGVVHVSGDLDDFHTDTGFVTRAELDVTGTRVRSIGLPNSHVDVRMTDTMAVQRRVYGHSKCGGAIGAPFDKQAYLADTSSHGEWAVNGDLLGDTVHLRNIVVTRAKAPRITGRALLRGIDLGPFARLVGLYSKGADGGSPALADAALEGQLWGELIVDDYVVGNPAASRIRLFLGPTIVSRNGQKLALQPPSDPVTLVGDALSMPPLALNLDTPDGFSGGFVLHGGATKLGTDTTLAFQADLVPLDLAILKRLVPRVDRASGRMEGSVRITGRAAAPLIAGEVHIVADDVEIRGAPTAITDVRLDVLATENSVTAKGTADFAGGVVTLDATAPFRGFDLGALDSRFTLRGVHVAPMEGVSATFDADLDLAYDAKASGAGQAHLPRLTGNVTIGSMAYTRPITFNLDLAGARAKRTEVNAYDPSQDFITFDVAVRSRAPLQIKNNLVEVQLGIDSGSVEVTGTNQRVGLRGVLRASPGGRFHFQSSDFEVQTGVIRFEDPTRIAPNVDVTAVTEYRRYTDTSTAAGAGSGGGAGAAAAGSTRGGSLWRILLHAYGDADNVRIEMTSEPALSQEDIALLLLVGMTRAELDQLQAGGIGESVALNVLGAASGADRAVKQALPIIDDFRFGSAYSTVTGKTEPQLTVGKRLTNDVRASVTAGLSEDRELRSDIEWRLNNRLSVEGSYDNINDVSSSALGNLGVDLRWRLEFE